MPLTPEYKPVFLGGREYRLRLFDGEMLEAFVARFRDQPLRDFMKYAESAGLPIDEKMAFQRDHFRNPPSIENVINAYLQTPAGLAYFVFISLRDNDGVTESWIESADWDEAEVQMIAELQTERMNQLAEKKTSTMKHSPVVTSCDTMG